jgi:hypothetical protein
MHLSKGQQCYLANSPVIGSKVLKMRGSVQNLLCAQRKQARQSCLENIRVAKMLLQRSDCVDHEWVVKCQ